MSSMRQKTRLSLVSCHESHSCKEMNLEEDSQASDDTAALTDALTIVLWDPEQRTQLSHTWTPDTAKLQSNKSQARGDHRAETTNIEAPLPSAGDPRPAYLVRGFTGQGSQASHGHMTLFNTGVPGSLCQDQNSILQRLPLLELQFPRDLGGKSKLYWFRSVQSHSYPPTTLIPPSKENPVLSA